LAAALVRVRAPGSSSDAGALAGAMLALAFGAAAIAKLVRWPAWRRALATYRLPAGTARRVVVGVPVLELAVATLPFLGLVSTAGAAALVALVAFSAVVVAGRLRAGRRLECGCFGSSASRDYRFLLARNLGLAVFAFVAWRAGANAPVVRSLGSPAGPEWVPAALVVLGLALATWVGTVAVTAPGRRGAP
ncbi:MAG: MauE/DoxX family redox-associated membrane protein, partial [Actinomycetota bacterium]